MVKKFCVNPALGALLVNKYGGKTSPTKTETLVMASVTGTPVNVAEIGYAIHFPDWMTAAEVQAEFERMCARVEK